MPKIWGVGENRQHVSITVCDLSVKKIEETRSQIWCTLHDHQPTFNWQQMYLVKSVFGHSSAFMRISVYACLWIGIAYMQACVYACIFHHTYPAVTYAPCHPIVTPKLQTTVIFPLTENQDVPRNKNQINTTHHRNQVLSTAALL